VPLYATVEVDITDRKHAEAALRRSEAYLAEAQKLSRTGSFGWHVASGEIFWSEETFSIFGYDKALSANIEMALRRVHPEDLAFVERIIDRASSAGTDFDFEHRLRMPDGAVQYVHVVGRAVRDHAGELEFIGSVMDVTAAKGAEEALHKAQADLAHAARVTTLGELAASIAHEINQPLAAVATSGYACLRWLNRDPPDLDEVRQLVARIVQDAHRAGDVIHSLRALAVKSGPQPTKLDLNGAIQEVLALIRSDLQRHSVALHTELSAHLHPVMADRVQVQQVLLNLITNAIDAMAITERPKMLVITAQPAQPDGVLVSVEDTGTGLDPAVADQIFAPFYTTKSTGMGMGLSICRTILEAHGGQLWAKPNVPQGTIFQFRLTTDSDVSDFA
jgi:PAS domain S-box-containing protein